MVARFGFQPHGRSPVVIRLLAVLLLLVAVAPAAPAAGADAHHVDFSLPDVTGQVHRLSDHRGKWVVVNFWATWCGPCMVEIPELMRFHARHKDHDAIVIGVNFEEIETPALEAFIAEMGIELPSGASGRYTDPSLRAAQGAAIDVLRRSARRAGREPRRAGDRGGDRGLSRPGSAARDGGRRVPRCRTRRPARRPEDSRDPVNAPPFGASAGRAVPASTAHDDAWPAGARTGDRRSATSGAPAVGIGETSRRDAGCRSVAGAADAAPRR